MRTIQIWLLLSILWSSSAIGADESATEEKKVVVPRNECLMDENFVRRKVLVSQRGVQCVDTPVEQRSVGSMLQFFQAYYVFDVYPSMAEAMTDKDYNAAEIKYFRIGSTPEKGSIIGWVPAEGVVRWNHRVGVRYNRGSGKRTPILNVYKDKDSLINLIKTGRSSTEPIARTRFDSEKTFMAWPVSEVERFPYQGRVYEMYKLHFLGGVTPGLTAEIPVAEAETTTPYTAEEIEEMKQQARNLDVVFAIDMTSSMQEFFEVVKATVIEMATSIARDANAPSINFGLVAYRDRDEKSKQLLEIVDMKDNYQDFLDEVSGMKAQGGGDIREAVFDGIKAALDRISWRKSALTERLLVLIGDCPGHEAGTPGNPQNITLASLVDQAANSGTEKKIRIFSMAVGNKDKDPHYMARWEQFSALSEKTDGLCVKLASSKELLAQMLQVVNKRRGDIAKRSIVIEKAERGEDPVSVVAEKKMSQKELVEVMEFLEGAGVDLARLKGGGVAYSSGWCLSKDPISNMELLKKEVLISRGELQTLIIHLFALSLLASNDVGKEAQLASLKTRLGNISFFEERLTGSMEVFLKSRGIPCSNGVLNLSMSEVENMSEEKRRELIENISQSIVPRLQKIQNDSGKFVTIDRIDWGWIEEGLLP